MGKENKHSNNHKMNLMNTIEELKTLSPCFDGFDYARQFTTLKEAWDRCERSDWMWWFAGKILPFTKECAVKYAHRCAEHVKDIKNNDAYGAAYTAAATYAANAATAAAYAATAANYAAAAAANTDAANAATYAAAAADACANAAAYAANAAACAANAGYAAYAANTAAYAANYAYAAERRWQAEQIREIISFNP
jgi:hypothetical protein